MSTGTPRNLQCSYALVYAAIVPTLQTIGRKHGYAITVHGSMATDLDLLACPWTEDATDAESLIEAIREYLHCIFYDRPEGQPQAKPHGRRAWSLKFDNQSDFSIGGPYIDISVMPRQAQEAD